ncbi:MAG TPA: hypothetical protein VFB17_02425 [Gaiellaceae bacterium]|jgi:hypothetical protein|nr:hypothetical protein [Gaiellaceae bacterium]
MPSATPRPHEHVAKHVHVLAVRAGVPYEIDRQVCVACARVLAERPVKRLAA